MSRTIFAQSHKAASPLRSIGYQAHEARLLVWGHGEEGLYREWPVRHVIDGDAAFADTCRQQRPLGKVAGSVMRVTWTIGCLTACCRHCAVVPP